MKNSILGYEMPEIVALVDKKGDSYLNRFKIISENKKNTFNWAAAFFGGYWLGYRKMWLESIIYFIVYAIGEVVMFAIFANLVLAHIVTEVNPAWPLLKLTLRICVFVLFGFIGDRVYLRNLKGRVNFLHLPEEVRNNAIGFKSMIKDCKGCSFWLGVIPAVIFKWITEITIVSFGTAMIQNWFMSVY